MSALMIKLNNPTYKNTPRKDNNTLNNSDFLFANLVLILHSSQFLTRSWRIKIHAMKTSIKEALLFQQNGHDRKAMPISSFNHRLTPA